MKIRGRGYGAKLLQDFIKDLGYRFNGRINAYSRHQFSSRRAELDYAFWYDEEVSKGFLTPCIDEITRSNFIQEYPIERKEGKRGRVEPGRVDYRIRYEPAARGIDMLVEVKQAWASMHNNKLKVRSTLRGRLEQCHDQVRSIQHPTWCSRDNVYGVAMVIVPVYASKAENNEKSSGTELESDKTKTIRKVENETGADLVLAYSTPPEFLKNYPEKSRLGEYFIPGFLIIFKTIKLSRDRA